MRAKYLKQSKTHARDSFLARKASRKDLSGLLCIRVGSTFRAEPGDKAVVPQTYTKYVEDTTAAGNDAMRKKTARYYL